MQLEKSEDNLQSDQNSFDLLKVIDITGSLFQSKILNMTNEALSLKAQFFSQMKTQVTMSRNGSYSQIVMKECKDSTCLPSRLVGDQRQLLLVLIILINNAIKHTERGGIKVQFCYDKENNVLIVQVKDTGVGLDQQTQQAINQNLKQLQTGEHSQSWLEIKELTIVKHLAEANGGKFGFSSRGSGHGSTFCFSMKLPKFSLIAN